MQECYADTATFTDSVFVGLNADEVRAMWEMLCLKAKDLTIEFNIRQSNDQYACAEWIATYTFSSTGNEVKNVIEAEFLIRDGKIVSHHDNFDFYHWSRQALGLKGLFLGWTPIVRNRVRTTARKNLDHFMSSKRERVMA